MPHGDSPIKETNPFEISILTPRSPNQDNGRNRAVRTTFEVASDPEDYTISPKKSGDISDDSLQMDPKITNNRYAMTTVRKYLNTIKTTITECKGKISVMQRDTIYVVMENLFDLVGHMNTEMSEMRGELKSLRPLAKHICEIKELIIKENKTVRTKIDKNIEDIKLNMETKTYAEITRNDTINVEASKCKKHEPIIIVKPKDKEQKNTVTKDEIKQNIDPVDFGVTGIRNFKQGAVIVECKNINATKKMEEQILSKMGEKYDVNTPKPKNPKLKIIGLSDKYTPEEIVSKIKMQNDYLQTIDSKIEIKFIKEVKTKRGDVNYTIFTEVDGKTYHRMLQEGKVNIGWDRCRVFDNISLLKCYKCNGYMHKAQDCRSEKACSRCSGSHDNDNENCQRDIQCVNCKKMNDRLKLQLPTNHFAWSDECSVHMRKIEAEKKKIDFLCH